MNFRVSATLLQVTSLESPGEVPYLRPCVVEVVFAGDIVPGRLQNISQRAADNAAPSVRDMQRAHRIRAHEFYLHALSLAQIHIAERSSVRSDSLNLRAQPVAIQRKVDEPRPRHGSGFDQTAVLFAIRQVSRQTLRDLQRIHSHWTRKL